MSKIKLTDLVTKTLDEFKAQDIITLDVHRLTDVSDCMVICTGTSNRHVKSLADHVVDKARAKKIPVVGMEGEKTGEWVLVDLGSVIVHIMQESTREFYQLEKLWGDNV